MICAQINPDGTLQAVTPQPAEMSGCAAVVTTGADSSIWQAIAFPSTADAGAAWSLGFVFVVGTYAIGRSVGAVLNFIGK